ncbi:PucR family transcriptional regulator [Prauserella oleivorans]|uniref:PucR family transcriptional regulator n=1 Tax=Prauserella oleivorans TaxID=1478153 RepID=A0ABW5WEY2_9PSEU
MAVTLRSLAGDTALGLRVLAGAAGLDRGISWVHPTELADPTAFLDGGELVLTTGLGSDTEPADAYVRRLADAGVAGLGFGVGLSHERVPRALIAAADAVELPLLEVPRPTPFIAISRAVSAALAAEQYESLVRTGRGQRELTRTALRRPDGAGALVRRLARLVDAWVVLVDAAGTVREAAPAAAAAKATSVRAELDRAHSGSRLLTMDGDEVVLQALGTRTRGFLAVGRSTRLDAADQHLVATAAALLSLSLERDRAHGAQLRGLRSGLLRLLLDGHVELALATLRDVAGTAPAPRWQVVVLAGPAHALAAALDALETEPDQASLVAEHESTVVVLGDVSAALRLPGRVPGLHAGVSSTVDAERTAAGHRQAEQAANVARADGKPVVRYPEHAGAGLLGLLGTEAARTFADESLAPLRAAGRPELETSLYRWLEHNGHWDAAASTLGVHRHTLRNRMARVAELLGRDLDSPGVRAELWLALNAGR